MNKNTTNRGYILHKMKRLQGQLSDAAFASQTEDIELIMKQIAMVKKELDAIKKNETVAE